jgi:hypothetical protein
MPFAAIEVGQLLDVVWESLVAAIVVIVAFSLVVRWSARSAEARRAGHGTAAVTYAGLAVLGLLAFGAVVVYGVHVMLSKG